MARKERSQEILEVMNSNKKAAIDGTAMRFERELAEFGLRLVYSEKWQEWTIRPISERKSTRGK